VTATHIDPFAPGDSPQHPANWVDEGSQRGADALADLYQWRRDHFARATEADVDIDADELERRHVRHAEYLDVFGSPDEKNPDAEFISLPVLLLRAEYTELDDEEIDEWKELFEQHATDDERDPVWVEGALPDLAELRARADVAAASAAVEPSNVEELPAAPKGNALKEEWVEYALAVSKARGDGLTFEQADAMTVADLKAAYKPKTD
jgi:hypothetical protein